MSLQCYFLINSLTQGGAERVLTLVTQQLAAENIEVEVICLEKYNFYQLSQNVKITYLSAHTGKENGLLKFLMLPILAFRLKRYSKNKNITLLQSHIYRANFVNILSVLMGAKHKTQLVNVGIISRYKNEGIIGKINLFLVKLLYAKADLIVLLSKGMQTDMQALFKLNVPQRIIDNPYNITEIEQKSTEPFNAQFLPDIKKCYILGIGRLVPLKRFDDLIHALHLIQNKFPDYELILLGDGPERPKLQKLAEELWLTGKVHFLGAVTNPFRFFKISTLFVSASSSEGFPNAIAEAMICHCPVLAADCISGPRELMAPATDADIHITNTVEIADCGVLVPVAKPIFMADAIETILSDEHLREKLKINAFNRIQEFDIKNVINQYKTLLFGFNN